ncbi:hypothetical protein GPJ56_006159 [Histomonas meleagridis]|uniref:uncharacterized protein n=1 Tax=Histomonas meleagridis TaxID=135588 RepID=UPI0035597F62|nr:hypothetical protein GPJ56_006159 [Histomonas meleagridis]KAH0797025.1 hypothetical protein GO595_010918 [Histomonas meleagridis]
MNSNAYSLRVIDEVSPTFAIASETSNVYTLELKHPEAIRTTTPYFGMDQTEQQTYAFTAHKYAQCAAIAHPYGVTCLHLFTGRQEQLPNFSRNRPLLANAMLFHEKKFALAIVQEHESILNAV